MKKGILAVLLMIIAGSFIAYAATVTNLPIEDWYSIRVALVNQEPDPVEPGKYVDVRFKIENRGSKNAEDVICSSFNVNLSHNVVCHNGS